MAVYVLPGGFVVLPPSSNTKNYQLLRRATQSSRWGVVALASSHDEA